MSRARLFALLSLMSAPTLTGTAQAQLPDPVFPTSDQWVTATPAELEMDVVKLAEAQAYAESKGGAGIIVRRGYRVHDWGSQTFRFPVFSVTKGIGALLLGVAADDGVLAVTDRAQTHFPGIGLPENADRSDWLAAITLEQLAVHSAGFTKTQGAPSMTAAPGTKWTYSDGGANWLGDTLTFALREDLREVLARRILDPLGVTVRRQDSEGGDFFWRNNLSREPTLNGIPRRELNSGMSLNVDAMARLGLLIERDGQWDGTRILSREYLERMAASATIIRDLPVLDDRGSPLDADFPNVTAHHGLLWFNNADGAIAGVPRDASWTWGAGDHLIVVIPSLELVIARTSGAAAEGTQPQPWDRQCVQGNWCAHYDVLAPFLTPIAQSVQSRPEPPPPPEDEPGGGGGVLGWPTLGLLLLLGGFRRKSPLNASRVSAVPRTPEPSRCDGGSWD